MTDTTFLTDVEDDRDTDPSPGTYEDDTPASSIPPQRYYEQAHKGILPGGVSAKSRHVTWTLRERGRPDKIVKAFGFHLNPQAISRGFTARSQLQATRARFYVDNFGPGPTTISVRQLVASGKHAISTRGQWEEMYTARKDVLRFLAEVYYPAQRAPDTYDIYFHDNHWSRGSDELVYFPASAVDVSRSVEQHGVWLVNITMVSLERTPFKDWLGPDEDQRDPENGFVSTVVIVARGSEILSKFIRRLIRTKYATTKNEKKLTAKVLDLNPDIRRARTEQLFYPDGTPQGSVTVKPFHLAPGQKIRVPVKV